MRISSAIFIAVICLLSLQFGAAAQAEAFVGPILAGQKLDPITYQDSGIIFQDVGTGRVWEAETPVTFDKEGVLWSPNGCKIMLSKTEDRSEWILLSISDWTFVDLLHPGILIWSLDGQSILSFQYSYSPTTTTVYVTDANGQNPKLRRSADEWMGHPQWLSHEELLYLSDNNNWLVWNIATDDIRLLLSEDEILSLTQEHDYIYSSLNLSPDHTMNAGYSDWLTYRALSIDNTDEGRSELEQREPNAPGFDLYFLKEGTTRHVNVNGQFVRNLVWSASSKKIAITTDYDGSDYGIFVYDIDSDTLQRVGDAYEDPSYGVYYPSWSPDENWLAFYTPNGYAIQNLSSGKRIQLDERMNGSRIYWSPVMDYSQSQCR